MADTGGINGTGSLSGFGTGLASGNFGGVTGGGISSAVSGVGNAVTDLFAAGAYREEAGLYGEAATLARTNEDIAGDSGAVKEYQAARSIRQTIGSQRAGIAAGNFQQTGDALTLLRSSTRQGYMTQEMIRAQTQINQNGYEAQAQSADAEKVAANAAASRSTMGAVFQGLGSAASIAAMI